MNQFCRHIYGNRILMVFFTIMALLFAQNLPLHAHNPNYNHAKFNANEVQNQHEHHSEIHVASMGVNDETHGPAIDLTAKAAVKNFKYSDVTVAILIFFVILFVRFPVSAKRWSAPFKIPFTTRGIAFRPPLRAPPR